MKNFISLAAILTAITVMATSFTFLSPPPRIYPELEDYFRSLDVNKFDKNHLQSLENIKYQMNASNMDDYDSNIIFYCSENTFRSQASQVFAHTLCYAKKYKKIKVSSAGFSAENINPKLIDHLSSIGYKITKSERNSRTMYTVRFSDKADPIILFSKTLSDSSLPKNNVISVLVCDTAKEADCPTFKLKTSPFYLPFEKLDETGNDEKVAYILKNIAAEMIYVTTK